MIDEQLGNLSVEIGKLLQRKHASVATAESCTGGEISRILTASPGSSAWYGYGFITYSNEAKKKLIGVQQATLDIHGAVSAAVVLEMAKGALEISGANYALSVSGIAGPDGGTPQKPVGTVYFGFASSAGRSEAWHQNLIGDRQQIRHQAAVWALEKLREEILENRLDTV